MSASAREVIETCVVTPTFCDGLHTVEIDRHGIARLTLYTEQRESYGGTMERIVSARLILPAAALPDIAARLLAAPQVTPPNEPAEPRRDLN